jgi:hypothetical protein
MKRRCNHQEKGTLLDENGNQTQIREVPGQLLPVVEQVKN